MKNLLLVVLAAAMMACGWLELTGLVMLGGFVPLLVLAGRYDSSRGAFWHMAGWTALFIALWYALSVWWVWLATPAGPIAAVFLAWIYTGGAFMLWFWLSKRAPKSLSYTVLVSGWTVGEWLYNNSQLSFPWLSVGNGFARDTWAVQWYEFTGEFGGTVWVLVSSILIYEFLVVRRPRPLALRNLLPPALAIVAPIALSLAIYFTLDEPTRTVKVSIVQPNVDPWGERNPMTVQEQTTNLAELIAMVPADTRFIVTPEAAIAEPLVESQLSDAPSLVELRAAMATHSPGATAVFGATTYRLYGADRATSTARPDDRMGGWYDIYNSALALAPDGRADIHHKAKLVPGAEMAPDWWWVRGLLFLIRDLDFYIGQYGYGTERVVFENGSGPDVVKAGAGICWESVYGQYTSEFVRNGAQLLFVITNDGWWGNTPGHRQHFDLSRLRAIETRRAVARSANTGRSGFITSRGDPGQTLQWEERGVITADVGVSDRITLFVRLGDWPARVSLLLLGLSVLYFIAWRIRKKSNIVN
ncbi:MAG: apolipoprotein N-acyltransferase [Alistipes sp.]|jgi:apolipoprotein N-acyltransferase|nr:apolipoprotein N-acyltransferase [Alistipes sp.]